MTIKGEKVFTNKARARVVEQFLVLARKSDNESARLRELATEVRNAQTLSELEKARRKCHSGDPDLLAFCLDVRNLCHYCGRKSHGGISHLLYGHPDWFCCWRTACQRRFDKDIARDKKEHPRAWAKRRSKKRWQPWRRRKCK